MPVATYPGTVTPLRGLGSFAESERDVFFGRDRERDELVALVTSDTFRAGLLYGEAGVGKTSLLRAGLQPFLRDHGVVALFCEDNAQPLNSFAQALSQTTGQAPQPQEDSSAYLARVISDADQMFLFILDDIDLSLVRDERVVAEVGELFSRVASRSAGRARFLFSCASDRVHSFGALEKRTGSLFPPANRYELRRMETSEATMVLDRTIALAGIACEAELAGILVQQLAAKAPLLPSDLQIAALSLKEQKVETSEQLARVGGYPELERRWIVDAAKSTGNERSAMRLLAELAGIPPGDAFPAQWVASQAGITLEYSHQALTILQAAGLVQGSDAYGAEDLQYSLSHEILCARVREVAAPAQQSAQKAFELLGSKAAQDKRLSAREFLKLRREGIVPGSEKEQAVIARTITLAKIAALVAVALPIVLTLVAYFAMSGSYYFDTAQGHKGVETIVVRSGKPELSWFFWLPHSPAFGSIVADTGLSHQMVTDEAWSQAASNEVRGQLDGDYAQQVRNSLTPQISQLVEYANGGKGTTLEALRATATTPEQLAQLLSSLRPIATGSPEETQFIEESLGDSSAVVQNEALMVAVAAANRNPGAYTSVLAQALASSNSERRRLSFSVLPSLPESTAAELFQAALALRPEPEARRELLARATLTSSHIARLSKTATTTLLGKGISDPTRAKAWRLLKRALMTGSQQACEDAAALVASSEAKSEDRILAMSLLLNYAPSESFDVLVPAVESALNAEDIGLQAAALPLYARIRTKSAKAKLTSMTEQSEVPAPLQAAAALAWGQVARMDETSRPVTEAILAKLLNSNDRSVRAAAARAYGYIGRKAQEELTDIVKKDYLDVAESAAYGLVNSTETGGSVSNAVGGIRDLWKRKGRLRRIAATAYAELARTQPSQAFFYLSASAHSRDDAGLHVIGMRGMCNAHKAGSSKAPSELARAAKDPQVEVRRTAIECVVDNAEDSQAALQVAAAMLNDSSGDIRAEAARVLAKLASAGHSKAEVGEALGKMAKDESRDVRVVAFRALATIGPEVPSSAKEALPAAFQRGDEGEKLVILATATAVGSGGLVQLGIVDSSPLVRSATLHTAIATKTNVAEALNTALRDPMTVVRRAALQRLSDGKHGLSPDDVEQALAMAVRDDDPGIAHLAMTASARLGDPQMVKARLATALQSRSENKRVQAAAASYGLVSHDPKLAIELLEPRLNDPSHDVRVALLPSLAAAYAASKTPEELAALMSGAEDESSLRLVTTAAFLLQAKTESEAVARTLEALATNKRGLVQQHAKLAQSLLNSSADGLAFIRLLVP